MPSAPVPATTNDSRIRQAWLAGMLVASAAAVAAIWCVPYLPTNDGPQHVLSGSMQNHYGDADAAYALYFVPQLQYAERGFATLFTSFEPFVGWRNALRLVLALIVLVHGWGFAFLVQRLNPARRLVGWVGFALAFSWPLYMGFFSFALGAALASAIIALSLGEATPRRRVGVGLALLAQAVVHVVTSAFTGAIIAALLVARAERGTRLRELARVAAMGTPAALVLVGALREHAPAATKPELANGYRPPLGDWIAELPRLFVPGPSARATVVLALFAAALVSASIRVRRRTATRDETTLLAAALLFLVTACVAPLDIPAWQYFAPRFFPFAASLGLALLATERVRARDAGRALAAALGGVTAWSLVTSITMHRRIYDGCRPELAMLDDAERWQGFTLPIAFTSACGVDVVPTRSEVPHLENQLHLGSLYAAARGGLTPSLLAGPPSIAAFAARPLAEAPPRPLVPPPDLEALALSREFRALPALRAAVLDRYAAIGRNYERLLLFGASEVEPAALEARGYIVDRREGSLALAHFAGCRVDAVFPVDMGAGRARVEYGLSTLTDPTWHAFHDEAIPASDGARHLAIGHSLCGDAWIRVTRNGAPVCRNADARGVLVFGAKRGETTLVACEPRL